MVTVTNVKTYEQMVEAGLITFPTTIDEATQSLIFDWFKYREVNNNDTFPLFFYRTLAKSARAYKQLLSIQPGQVVEFPDGTEKEVTYDWLVQKYRESKNTLTESGTSTKSSNGEDSSSVTNSGSDVKTKVLSGTDTTDRDISNVSSGTVNTDTASTSSGSSSSTREGSSSTSSSEESEGSSTVSGTNNTATTENQKTLAKSAPQSISYAAGIAGMPATLDWTYPGSQGEASTTGTNNNTTSQTQSDSNEGSVSSSTENEDSANNTNQATESGSVDTTTSGTDTTTEDVTSTTARNETETSTKGTTLTKLNQNENSESNANSRSGEYKNIENGRDTEIATLLQNAKTFILSGDAWDYLYGQLNKCFQGITMEW